jgi:3-oxoacyl-[acyl-carrier protein] reductase
VTDADAVSRAAAETVARLGRMDVMVASAGITGPNATTWEYPLEEWRRVLAIDLDGVFHCFRAAAPIMKQAGYGRIIALASMAGKEGNAKAPAYSAAKAGVIGLVKSTGKELAGTGVTVNCVAPAAVRTAIFEQMDPKFVEFLLSKIPMGRFGTTEEVAALICWIASREASFSTGATFDCSGGRAVF